MMTSSAQIGMSGGVKAAQAQRLPRRGAVREWLPVPAPSLPQAPAIRGKSALVARSIWLQPEGESKAEKFLLFLLASAAVIGIGYGLSCLIDLVQGWAEFNIAIAQMVH